MDKPIGVGDLVMVVRKSEACPCPSTSIGTVYRVSQLLDRKMYCTVCGVVWGPVPHAKDSADGLSAELYRLKRIPPLSELEGEKRDEEITA